MHPNFKVFLNYQEKSVVSSSLFESSLIIGWLNSAKLKSQPIREENEQVFKTKMEFDTFYLVFEEDFSYSIYRSLNPDFVSERVWTCWTHPQFYIQLVTFFCLGHLWGSKEKNQFEFFLATVEGVFSTLL